MQVSRGRLLFLAVALCDQQYELVLRECGLDRGE
jgi:hypothetical protein